VPLDPTRVAAAAAVAGGAAFPHPLTAVLLHSRSDEGTAHSSGGLVGLPCGAAASPFRVQRGDAVSPDDDAAVKAAKGAAGRRRWQCSKGLECCALHAQTTAFSGVDPASNHCLFPGPSPLILHLEL
jgi:hypothetical protein